MSKRHTPTKDASARENALVLLFGVLVPVFVLPISLTLCWALSLLRPDGAVSGSLGALTVGVGLLSWALVCAAIYWIVMSRQPVDTEQHKRDAVPVAEQREHNREWVKHARHEGATEVRVWFAVDEYDDAEQIDVPIGQALQVLAKHTKDAHLDAVGRAGGHEVGLFLTEWAGVSA